MESVRQKCRPKHQVLVLKCYPKFQKNVTELKPNSSELSYLLYYASTRRSKLQKVGAFLEKRTASDAWRGKIGNVQVTLQILTALIEKTPRDLALYSPYVLRIIKDVLRSQDLTMVEATLPTFEMYCKYQDTTALAADQDRVSLYAEVMSMYSAFATEGFFKSLKTAPSTPVKIRWRNAGLEAIKSVVSCEIPVVFINKQFEIVMPSILENLASDEEESLSSLHKRMQSSEKTDIEHARKRRQSLSTIQTADENEGDVATAACTTADADRAAEEEVRILALCCLKQVYVAGSNRGLILTATRLVLKFIVDREHASNDPTSHPVMERESNWGTSVMEMIAKWAPVQDRFIIIVTAVEQLVSSPTVEDDISRQLALVKLIDWLLSSSINMIGLSVIDVLLGFVQHTLQLLQLGENDSRVPPHHQQTISSLAAPVRKDAHDAEKQQIPGESVAVASPQRQELVTRLQQCIGDLATHIYYTDQISDMITAIMARLKPSPDAPSTVAAIENPVATSSAAASAAQLQENPATDQYFSFATAKITALQAVKSVITVANMRKSIVGSVAAARNPVSVHVWEGTQWLLRDEDRGVRRAYVDALLTWLNLETSANDLKVTKEERKSSKASKRDTADSVEGVVKRAVSNSTPKDGKKSNTSHFLKFLHLAIYDDAIEAAESQEDILLLHLLMVSLVENLGVNATANGLPMIFRLQEDINDDDLVKSPTAKMNVGSLVHGYFWALSERFKFDTSKVGKEIHSEIARRKTKKLWMEKIRLPPTPLDAIESSSPGAKAAFEAIENESLCPFDGRSELIEQIAIAYNTVDSPPSSPPTSPGKVFSITNLAYAYSSTITTKPAPLSTLPSFIKDQLILDWTKEACIASVETDKAHTVSLNGSKTGTTGQRGFLSVNGDGHNASSHLNRHDRSRPPSIAFGLVGGLGNLQKIRHASLQEGSNTPGTSSSRDSTIRVDELRRALADNPYQVQQFSPLRARHDDTDAASNSSDSLVSGGDFSMSDAGVGLNIGTESTDFAHGNGQPTPIMEESNPVSRSSSVGPDPNGQRRSANQDDEVPPVPPLPASLALPGGYPGDTTPTPSMASDRAQSSAPAEGAIAPEMRSGRAKSMKGQARSYSRPGTSANGSVRSRSRGGWTGGNNGVVGGPQAAVLGGSNQAAKMDLAQLLGGISSGGDGHGGNGDGLHVSGEEGTGLSRSLSGVVKPPY